MVKILPANLDNFYFDKTKRFNAILFYGADDGLIEYRAKNYFSKMGNISVTKINYKQVKKNFLEELKLHLEPDLFCAQKVIWVFGIDPAIDKAHQEFLNNYETPPEIILIYTTDELPPSSSLRKFFETNEKFAVAAIYKLDPRNIKIIVSAKLARENITITDSLLSYLSHKLTPDFNLINSEIERLIIYVGLRKNITNEDINAVCADKIENDLDLFVSSYIKKDYPNFYKYIENLEKENVSQVLVMRSLQRQVSRLLQVKEEIGKGKSFDDAITVLSPPIFFMQKTDFALMLKCRKVGELKKMLQKSFLFEKVCKTSILGIRYYFYMEFMIADQNEFS